MESNPIDIQFANTPDPHWNENVSGFFSSVDWAQLLNKAFGCRLLYLTVNSTYRIVMPVFKVGPFRIGYLGFPLLYSQDPDIICDDFFLQLKRQKFCIPIDVINSAVGSFDAHTLTMSSRAFSPETQIINFPEWSVSKLPKKIRRDIKHSLRQGLVLKNSSEMNYPDEVHQLYLKTVKRKQGVAKYNSEYFSALFEYSQQAEDVQFLFAFKDSDIVGFGVFVKDASTVYYLHGAIDIAFKKLGITDFLVYHGILWALDIKSENFNFMTSPNDQPQLVRYKEKWGGETQQQLHYELVRKPVKTAAFKFAKKIHQLVS